VKVHSVRWHSVYVAPIRLALGLVWLLAAKLAGASMPSASLAFVSSAFFLLFIAFNDPRARFLKGAEPQPLPAGAEVASPVEQALAATLPSTVGLSVLAAIALVPQPILAALLGGVTAGLGAAGVLRAYFADPALFFDRKTGAVYRR
jgi:hypothetical protein